MFISHRSGQSPTLLSEEVAASRRDNIGVLAVQ